MSGPASSARRGPDRLRGPLLLVALACGAAAGWCGAREAVPLPPLAAWEAGHPDPRPLQPAEAALFGALRDEERARDLALFLGGLAAGGLVVAAWPRLAKRTGGALPAVLVAGSVAIGLFTLGRAVHTVAEAAATGEWTLADDALAAIAGDRADDVRAFRTRIGTGDAIVLVGTDGPLWNLAAWALFPRPIYPLTQGVPPSLDERDLRAAVAGLDLGTDTGRRWLLDVDAWRAGRASARPVLVEVTP